MLQTAVFRSSFLRTASASCPSTPSRAGARLAAIGLALVLTLLAGRPLHAAAAATGNAGFDFDAVPGLLSKQVVPQHYALSLRLDPASSRFSGEVRIDLRVRSDVRDILLHADQLDAGHAELLDPKGGRPRDLDIRPDAATRTWRLVPADGQPVTAGSHALQLSWSAQVERNGQGLFGVDYKTPQGDARMLATQLEPRFARRVFPCFDEPSFRATFALQVTAPKGLDVLSNTPAEKSERDGADDMRWTFARTPSMPTYLFAVAVGRFERVEDTIDGIRVSVLSTAGKREQGRYALQAMRQVLPHYRGTFGISFPLPKLDLLAVPGVMNGAMENWGLITFEESVLLLDPKESAPQRREVIYGFIAHEVAHQWFGNLVTAASWDEIWLNEAFATWLGQKTSAKFNPQWKRAEGERLERADALGRDATKATRAIRSGPVSEEAVFDVFDDITYAKGGAVLSMLEDWLGPERFREGLAAYMNQHKYSNATAADLWRHIGQAAGRDVQAVVSSWTDQPGYPLIDATWKCREGRTELKLAQSAFRFGDFARPLKWQVPVRVNADGVRRFVLLDTDEATMSFPGCSDDTTVIVNAGDVGFYRVRYETEVAEKLLAKAASLPDRDRLMLQDDAFALALAGQQSVALYLRAVARLPTLPREAALLPALQAVDGIEFIDQALMGSPTSEPFAGFARSKLAPLLERLGWETPARDDPLSIRLRGKLIGTLARLGDGPVRVRASASTRTALSGSTPLEPSTREAVLSAAAAGADDTLIDALVEALRTESREERRRELARALGSVQTPSLADRVLSLTLDDRMPSHVLRRLPAWLSQDGRQAERALDFALRHFDALSSRSSEWGRVWILPGAASGSALPGTARKLVEQQSRLVGEIGDATAAIVAAEIELRARFREREAVAIDEATRGSGG